MNATDVEKALLSHPLPDLLPADEGWVMPHYGGLSIANLPATIATLLGGAALPGALPPLPRDIWADWTPGLQRVVLIILDGLGYRLLQRRLAKGEAQVFSDMGAAGRMLPLTSVFPSTTDAALTSLHTGYPPATHGWLAWEMYLREVGVAANAVLLRPIWSRQRDLLVEWGLQPETLVTVPTLARSLASVGVVTTALQSRQFEKSGFSRLLYRDMQHMRGHLDASDFWTQLRHMLGDLRGKRAFVSAYWGGLDTLGHAYGPDTELWNAELRTVSHLLAHEFLARLPAKDREGALLLITADHGQILIPGDHVVTGSELPELCRHLQVPIMGEPRAAFLYPRPGRAAQIRDLLEKAFPGWFAVLDSGEALAQGLLGTPVADETYARLGELLVLGRGTHALQGGRPPTPLLGRHGGLTRDEMLVPLVGIRLDALPT